MTKHIIPLTVLILLIVFLGASLKPGMAANSSQPVFQETAYPVDTPGGQPTSYAGPGEPTSYEGPGTPSATSSPTATLKPGAPTFTLEATQTVGPSPTIGSTPTLRPSPTKGRDLFATEDAEIQNARVTLIASETPAPSWTARPSLTPTASGSPTPIPVLTFNSSWFLAGLLPPTLIVLALGIYYRLKNSGEFHR